MNAKRWMALFLALTMAASLLTGCTKKSDTPAQPEQGQTEQEENQTKPEENPTKEEQPDVTPESPDERPGIGGPRPSQRVCPAPPALAPRAIANKTYSNCHIVGYPYPVKSAHPSRKEAP